MDDVDLLVGGLGRDQTRSETQALAQPERPRFFRDEGIRPGLDEKIADLLGSDGAAEASRAFEQCDF